MKIGEGLIDCGIPVEKWARVQILHTVLTTHNTTIGKGETVIAVHMTARRVQALIDEKYKQPRPVFVQFEQPKNRQAFLANIRSEDIRLVD